MTSLHSKATAKYWIRLIPVALYPVVSTQFKPCTQYGTNGSA